jgi:hypothetical protein
VRRAIETIYEEFKLTNILGNLVLDPINDPGLHIDPISMPEPQDLRSDLNITADQL